MGRRFFLVGVFIIFPFHQGSVMQIAIANLFAIIYLVLLLQAMPYRSSFHNYLALGCTFALTVLLLCTIFYKYQSFTELPDIVARMSREQVDDYEVAGLLLSGLFIASVFGALGFSALLLVIQVGKERRRRLREERMAKARRLRWAVDDTEVELDEPVLQPVEHTMGQISSTFHIFLSHAWGTGQDQMRIVKQRLLEMLPDVRVFLGARWRLKQGDSAKVGFH